MQNYYQVQKQLRPIPGKWFSEKNENQTNTTTTHMFTIIHCLFSEIENKENIPGLEHKY